MCHSQKLRRPLLVPCPTQCPPFLLSHPALGSFLRHWTKERVRKLHFYTTIAKNSDLHSGEKDRCLSLGVKLLLLIIINFSHSLPTETRIHILYKRYYNLRYVCFLPHFWRQKHHFKEHFL